jgi:hypothetical protein
MALRCVALLSGGLDSRLAIRIMQMQGVEVEALSFKMVFECCQDEAGRAAREFGVRLTMLEQDDEYLELVREPKFGYGKGANPCVDCRIYMFRKAKRLMAQAGARFVVSGEVVGQRPMSQKRRDLDVIARHSGLEDLLLRPLSAKLLPPTLPERRGWVDRQRLYGFEGRSRKGLIRLAEELGLREIPGPSTGCALTEPRFARKVFDLLELQPENGRWDFELLKLGRHFRLDGQTKIIVGRHEAENSQLEYMHGLPEASSTALLTPDNFTGPLVLVIGPVTDAALRFAGGLVLRYSKYAPADGALLRVVEPTRTWVMPAAPSDAALRASTLPEI